MTTPITPEKETILQEAQRLVYGDRQKDYGHPIDDYTKVADFWSIILRPILLPCAKISPLQAALMMTCIKISRELNKHKRDNLTDLAGYAAVTNMIADEMEKRNNDSTTKPCNDRTTDSQR